MSENNKLVAPHPHLLSVLTDRKGNIVVDNANNAVLSFPTLEVRMGGNVVYPEPGSESDGSDFEYTFWVECSGQTYEVTVTPDEITNDFVQKTEIGTFYYYQGDLRIALNLRKLREIGESVKVKVGYSVTFVPLYKKIELENGKVQYCWYPLERLVYVTLDGWVGKEIQSAVANCGQVAISETIDIDFKSMTATMTSKEPEYSYGCTPDCQSEPPGLDVCAKLMWCNAHGALVYTQYDSVGSHIWQKAWNPQTHYPNLKIAKNEDRKFITIKPDASTDEFKDNNGYTVRFWRNISGDLMNRYPVLYVWHHGSNNGADTTCTDKDILFVTDAPKFDSYGNFDSSSNTGVIYRNADRRDRPPAEDAEKCKKDDQSNIISNGVSWKQGEVQWLTTDRHGNELACAELLTRTSDTQGDYRKYTSRNYTVWFIPKGDTGSRNHHCYFDSIADKNYVDYAIEFYHKGIYFEFNGNRYLYTDRNAGYYVFSDIYRAWSPSPCVSVDINYNPVYTDEAMSDYYMYQEVDFTKDGVVVSNSVAIYSITSDNDVEYYSLEPRKGECPREPPSQSDEEFE